ncbi:MAG: 50S ribosomal protein L3 [Planctomycetota bacterium]
MSIGLLGRKQGMTQIYGDNGVVIPVTVIQAGPCLVTQIKKTETDGYSALQVAFEKRRANITKKPLAGHFKKAGVDTSRFLREMRLASDEEIGQYELGQALTVSLFQVGQFIDVAGTSKGRGFTGVIKRHGFSGMRATHGTHEFFRHGGAIGMHSYPSRVFKGMKMAGQHGNVRVTTQNLKVVQIDEEKNLLVIKGAVPGPRNGLVEIYPALKKPAPTA